MVMVGIFNRCCRHVCLISLMLLLFVVFSAGHTFAASGVNLGVNSANILDPGTKTLTNGSSYAVLVTATPTPSAAPAYVPTPAPKIAFEPANEVEVGTKVLVNVTDALSHYKQWGQQIGPAVTLTILIPNDIEPVVVSGYLDTTVSNYGHYKYYFTPNKVGNYSISCKVSYKWDWMGASLDEIHENSVNLTVKPINSPTPTASAFPSVAASASPTAAASQTSTSSDPTPTASGSQSTAAGTGSNQASQPSAVPYSGSDNVAPVTTLSLSGNSDGNGTYTSNVICVLTALDNQGGSGVAVIQYCFDGSSWQNYSVPFSVSKPGLTTVYYRSIDLAGNREVANLQAINVGSAPTSAGVAAASPAPSTVATVLALVSLAALIVFYRRKNH